MIYICHVFLTKHPEVNAKRDITERLPSEAALQFLLLIRYIGGKNVLLNMTVLKAVL